MPRPSLQLAAAVWLGLWAAGQAIALQAASSLLQDKQSDIGSLSGLNLEMIRKHAGLYSDKSAHPEYANTVLVTASNIAYSEMLRNWCCYADKLGLDYVIIAMDPELLKEAGSDRTFLVDGNYFPDPAEFRHGHFNEISCTKLRIVKEIMMTTGLNVVFSDPDNVFRGDPFAPGVSLGDKMRSGRFQYVYQQNHNWNDVPEASDLGAQVVEGNTGFYYVSGATKAKGVQALFKAALLECKRKGQLDDQVNFWSALTQVREGHALNEYKDKDSFKCADLCGKGKTCAAADDDVLSYCEMDPWNHATGWNISNWKGKKEIVTYHANFVVGMDEKIRKLQTANMWDTKCVEASAKR